MLVTSDSSPLSAFPIPRCKESSTLCQHRKDPFSTKIRIVVLLSSTVSRRHLESNSGLPIMMPTLKPFCHRHYKWQVWHVAQPMAAQLTNAAEPHFHAILFKNERLFVATRSSSQKASFRRWRRRRRRRRCRQPRSFLDENRIAFSVPNRFPLFTEEMEK